MMKVSRKTASVLWTIALAAAFAGCDGGKSYRLGKTAEKKGDSAEAYDHYVRAASKLRSGIVANGLERTRDDAAAQSERAGLAAMDEGRYDDAWRLFMRTLDIQPGHATAAQLVRKLENEHPDAIAAVRHEWMMRGAVALSAPKDQVLTLAKPPAATPESDPASTKIEPAPASVMASAAPPRSIPAPSEAGEGRRTEPPTEHGRQSDSRPIAPPDHGEFLAIHTLSLKDRRYPRMAIAVEGIGVKLKDTDDDGEVDLDLFDGNKRFQKVRDLETGRSQTFQAKSGELYRLTVLAVHHKSRTVKIGLKRA